MTQDERSSVLETPHSARAVARLLAGRSLEGPAQIGAALGALCAERLLSLPQPGSGRTVEHHATLVEIAAADLSLARLAEGHSDALVILGELAGDAARAAAETSGATYGVWAAEPPDAVLEATRVDGGFRLQGTKRYASGAHALGRALVTARADDGVRLFDVDLRVPGVTPRAGTWQAVGMADSDSVEVRFEGVRVPAAAAIGEPGAYVDRPGLAHGGIRVAACWAGGAVGATRTLAAWLRAKPAIDAHQAASFGAMVSTCRAILEVLGVAARAIDADPGDARTEGTLRALHVRRVVEQGATEVLRECGRAAGSGLMVFDRAHARRVADLPVYLRQHHAGRDLEALGRRALATEGAC